VIQQISRPDGSLVNFDTVKKFEDIVDVTKAATDIPSVVKIGSKTSGAPNPNIYFEYDVVQFFMQCGTQKPGQYSGKNFGADFWTNTQLGGTYDEVYIITTAVPGQGILLLLYFFFHFSRTKGNHCNKDSSISSPHLWSPPALYQFYSHFLLFPC
jgi:hypothetical protein